MFCFCWRFAMHIATTILTGTDRFFCTGGRQNGNEALGYAQSSLLSTLTYQNADVLYKSTHYRCFSVLKRARSENFGNFCFIYHWHKNFFK